MSNSAAAAGWDALGERLDRLAARDGPVRFWLRDDDAVAPSPALDRLLGLAADAGAPLALAVIPAEATDALARRLAAEPNVRVLQHGFSHRSHAPEGEKKAELGDHRPADAVLAELREGAARLKGFPRRQAVLVPPWNRIGPRVAARLAEAGFLGLSLFGERRRNPPAPGLAHLNAHFDPVDWHGTRRFHPPETLLTQLCARLDALLSGAADPAEPTGLLTHHRIHCHEDFMFLRRVLDYFAQRGDCRFLSADALLAVGEVAGTVPDG